MNAIGQYKTSNVHLVKKTNVKRSRQRECIWSNMNMNINKYINIIYKSNDNIQQTFVTMEAVLSLILGLIRLTISSNVTAANEFKPDDAVLEVI